MQNQFKKVFLKKKVRPHWLSRTIIQGRHLCVSALLLLLLHVVISLLYETCAGLKVHTLYNPDRAPGSRISVAQSLSAHSAQARDERLSEPLISGCVETVPLNSMVR
jgi:hypothetical protein